MFRREKTDLPTSDKVIIVIPKKPKSLKLYIEPVSINTEGEIYWQASMTPPRTEDGVNIRVEVPIRDSMWEMIVKKLTTITV